MKYDFPKEIQFLGQTLRETIRSGPEIHYNSLDGSLFVRHWLTPRYGFGVFSSNIRIKSGEYIENNAGADSLAELERAARQAICRRIVKLDEERQGFHAFL